MTAVPVVSATLTTRTVHEVCDNYFADGSHRECLHCDRRGVRERLTVDPVFVVLPEAPDLTCPVCSGDGTEHLNFADCPWCGGTGVSPVYAATWKRQPLDLGKWVNESDMVPPIVDDSWRSRRQVTEWVAHGVQVIEVIDAFVLALSGWEHLEQPHTEMRCNDVVEPVAGYAVPCCNDRVPLSVPDGVLSWIELP